MNFLELVKARSSVRKYLSKEVEQEKLDYIMECARLAPSAANFQPWYFYIIKSPEAKQVLYESYGGKWFSSYPAPVYIVACGDKTQSWKRSFDKKDHVDIDVAITFEHICLAAADRGLGTCWICAFDPVKLTGLLNLPEHHIPVAITPIGYPETTERDRPFVRKSVEEVSKII
jgi:Nitroreductase